MARVFAVASAKGGVGKTTTTANVGAFLAETGADVVVIDGDIGMANLGAALGVSSQATIHDVLSGEATVSQATVEGPGGLYVVPGDTALSSYADADPTELKSVIQTHSQADYVLIDVGAGLSHESSLPLSLADEVLLVSTPDRDALLDTEKTRQLTEQLGGEVAGAVITRTEPTTPLPEMVTNTLATTVLATVPEDEAVQESLAVSEPLSLYAPQTPAAAGYRELAAELTGVEPPEPEPAAETDSTTAEPTADTEPEPESSTAAGETAAEEPTAAETTADSAAATELTADNEPPAEAESKWAEAATGSGIDTESDAEQEAADDSSQSVADDAIPFRESSADAESDEVDEAEPAAESDEAESDTEADEAETDNAEPAAGADDAVEIPDSEEQDALDVSEALGISGSGDDAAAGDDSADAADTAASEADTESSDSDTAPAEPSVESETVEIGATPDTDQESPSASSDEEVVIPDAEPEADETAPDEAVEPSPGADDPGAMTTELAAGESEDSDDDDEKKGFLRRLFFG